MIGGGFINDMNKTIERNKAMLKKKSLKEKLDEYGSSKGIGKDWKYKKASKTLLDDIRIRTARARRKSVFKGILLLLFVAVPFAFGAWVLLNQKLETPPLTEPPTESQIDLFTKEFHDIEKGMQLKVEYFRGVEKQQKPSTKTDSNTKTPKATIPPESNLVPHCILTTP